MAESKEKTQIVPGDQKPKDQSQEEEEHSPSQGKSEHSETVGEKVCY